MTLQNLGFFLHHCAKAKALRSGISLHAAAIKTGRIAETFTCNHILNFYAKCGLLHPAHQMFDEMPHRNLVTWSAMISGYNLWDRPHKALQLFSEMQKHFKPNDSVFSSTLSSCGRSRDLNLGQQIHALALKLSYYSVSFVVNSLILVYMKCGMCADALSVFNDGNPTLVSYNIAITGLVENKLQEKGMELFVILLRQGLLPDRYTFAGLLGPPTPGETVYGLSTVVQLHCQMVKLGLDCMSFSGNVLMTLYSKFSLFQESDKAFRSIGEKDVVSWNTAITDCCRCEDHSRALEVFREMDAAAADDYTYASVLSAAASMASARIGKEIHGRLIRAGPDWDVGVENALVNMYAKCGYITLGHTVFERMEIRNLVSWNTMIAAFANHGRVEKVMTLFEEMKMAGVEPDSITFLELLAACNHAGLADEGQMVFDTMSGAHGIVPRIEHLCCLVDLLGRSGRLGEAEEYTRRYFCDDEVVLGCLLSACRLHGDVGVGERIAERLIKLDPVAASPYVLLSNLCAMKGKWDGVLRARRLLEHRGLEKEAARASLIDIHKEVHMEKVGL